MLLLAFLLSLTAIGSNSCLVLGQTKVPVNTSRNALISQERTTQRREPKPGVERGSGVASYTDTGVLNFKRYSHTSTLLPNGKVLVAGGSSGSAAVSSAELFDPATGAWTLTGSLHTARFEHTATLLPNGKVLIVGVQNGVHFAGNAELYDPATGTWSITGDALHTARSNHTATLLPDGRVLVTGGTSSGNQAIVSSELYDPSIDQWSDTGNINDARSSHTATLLSNGKVLITGGENSSGSVSDCEIYDPITGIWTLTDSLSTARKNHQATLLPDGKVLITGGQDASQSLGSTELYDPNSGLWSAGPALNDARSRHTSTLLSNGLVVVAGGSGTSGVLATVEIYDPVQNLWTTGGNLSNAREQQSATLLTTGKIIITGGQSFGAAVNSSDLLNVGPDLTETKRPIIDSVSVAKGKAVSLSGSGFAGTPESSGDSTNRSATDVPIVQIYRLDNSQISYFPFDAFAEKFSDSSITTGALPDFPAGPALVTVFTNGIQSVSGIVVLQDTADVYILADYAVPVVAAGGPLIYQFAIANRGPSVATGVKITHIIPAGATLVSCTSDKNGVCTNVGSTQTINIPQLQIGNDFGVPAVITITCTVNAGVPEGTFLTDDITVTANQFDPDLSDNVGGVSARVGKPSTTSISAPSVTVGNNATVTVTVTSAFETPSGNVLLTFDGTDFSPVPMSGGVATIQFNPGSAGTHTLLAVYLPTSLNSVSGASSQTGSLTVLKLTPNISMTGTPKIVSGTPNVVITGKISSGTSIPSGSVSVTVNGLTQPGAITSGSGNFSATIPSTNFAPGSYPISLVYAGDTNFNAASNNSNNLVVIRGILTVTADNKTKSYGSPDPPFTFTITGFAGNDTIAIVSGAPILSGGGLTAQPGNYAISVSKGSLSAPDYDFQFIGGTLTVTKGILTVRPDNKTKVWGDPLPAFTYTITGFVLNDKAFSGVALMAANAGRFSDVGHYSINVTSLLFLAPNYDFVSVPGELEITRATPFILNVNRAIIAPYGSAPITVSGRVDWFNEEAETLPKGFVTVQIGNQKQVVKLAPETGNFSAHLSILSFPRNPFPYDITITYSGSATFVPVTITAGLGVVKADSAITNTTPLTLSSHSTRVEITGRAGLNPPALAEVNVRQKRGTTIGAGPVDKILPAITGTVSITFAGTTIVAQVNSKDGSFKAVFENVALSTAGSPYSVTFNYSGDANINPSSKVIEIAVSDNSIPKPPRIVRNMASNPR